MLNLKFNCMKKVIIAPFLLALAILFTGCEKVEQSEMVLDTTQKATLKVYCYAQLDHTQLGLEFVPNGTKVMVRIDNNNFNPGATGYWSAVGEVQNGVVEFEIPVTLQGITARIFPMEFTYNQIQPFGSNVSTITKIFRFTGAGVEDAIKPREIRTHQLTYTEIGTYNNAIQKISRKFQLRAELDLTNTTLEYVPTGTNVYFFNEGWMTQKTVGDLGAVDVDVPYNEHVYVRFQATKIVYENGEPVPRNYLYNVYVGSYTTSSPVVETIHCGNGTIWE